MSRVLSSLNNFLAPDLSSNTDGMTHAEIAKQVVRLKKLEFRAQLFGTLAWFVLGAAFSAGPLFFSGAALSAVYGAAFLCTAVITAGPVLSLEASTRGQRLRHEKNLIQRAQTIIDNAPSLAELDRKLRDAFDKAFDSGTTGKVAVSRPLKLKPSSRAAP